MDERAGELCANALSSNMLFCQAVEGFPGKGILQLIVSLPNTKERFVDSFDLTVF